jgi:hypothetical protein
MMIGRTRSMMIDEEAKLDNQIRYILYAFIESIEVNTIEDNKSDIKLVLLNKNDRYVITSISASESNLNTLWSLYESTKVIVLTVYKVNEYLVLEVLGNKFCLIETDDNIYTDIAGLMELEEEENE